MSHALPSTGDGPDDPGDRVLEERRQVVVRQGPSDAGPGFVEADAAVPRGIQCGDRGGAGAGLGAVDEDLLAFGAKLGDDLGRVGERGSRG